jgi:hypothetical protein
LGDKQTLSNPDAELISACDEYLRRKNEFSAMWVSVPGDVPEDHPSWAILDPIDDLTTKIINLPATTAEGYHARGRCAAFNYLPTHSALLDNPDLSEDNRFQAANLRDLVMASRDIRS